MRSHPSPAEGRSASPWFVRPRPNPHAQSRLFCLPYAGGGASIFRNWPAKLSAHLEVCPISLPGREARFRDRPFTLMPDLVSELAEALRPVLDLPFAFFGHSMGALIAFELARRIRRTAGSMPAGLLVSGCRPPRSEFLDPGVYALPDGEFLDRLSRRYRAIPNAVRANAELLELVLPTLRADFELLARYEYRDDEALTCPILALGGDRDDTVSPEDLRGWAEYTRGPFNCRTVPGDHFFLKSAESELLAIVAGALPPAR